jgi:L-alanine-DL-glutamate epimerase-like enolase superfamily enzyme
MGWTYAPAWCAEALRERLAPLVVGRSVLDVPRCHEEMVDAVRNLTRPGPTSMAISAVDTALWDLEARVLEVPLHSLLGPGPRAGAGLR